MRLPALALGHRLDLPLQRDGSGRFLPWIVALMVYLAALALAGMLALAGAVERWDGALSGTLTVQLPPAAAAKEWDVLAALRAMPGVRNAESLDDKANAALLEPWLGPAPALGDLALPRLIDLKIDPAAPPDRAALERRLAELAPGSRLEDNRGWLDPLLEAAFAAEMVAAAIVLLVGAAAVLSIVFATRTGLAIHHGTVEVLHLIGAQDRYIARQFAWQALRLGLRGGVIGLLGAALTLLALDRAAGTGAMLPGGVSALPRLTLDLGAWVVLVLLPAAAGLTALATAHITVLRALARMP